LPAGKGGRGLPKPDIAETDIVQRRELRPDRRDVLEESERLVDRHVEHVGNVLSPVENIERLPIVALALADLTGDVDIRQELHLDLDDAFAFTGLAPPALDVERESPWAVTAGTGLGHRGEQFPDRGEGTGVGGRV